MRCSRRSLTDSMLSSVRTLRSQLRPLAVLLLQQSGFGSPKIAWAVSELRARRLWISALIERTRPLTGLVAPVATAAPSAATTPHYLQTTNRSLPQLSELGLRLVARRASWVLHSYLHQLTEIPTPSSCVQGLHPAPTAQAVPRTARRLVQDTLVALNSIPQSQAARAPRR